MPSLSAGWVDQPGMRTLVWFALDHEHAALFCVLHSNPECWPALALRESELILPLQGEKTPSSFTAQHRGCGLIGMWGFVGHVRCIVR